MAGTANGAAKRQRRHDGAFSRRPLNERLRSLDVDKKRALKFVPRALENHVQADSLPHNEGRAAVQPIWTFAGLVSSYAKTFRNPDEAIRDNKENARNMRNDCSIMECIEARQRAVELLNWHIQPEDEKNPEQVAACETMTRILKKIPNFKKYRHSLLEAIWYGRYAVNQEWGWCFDQGRKLHYVAKWAPLNGDKLVFRFDEGDGKYDPDQVGIRVSRHLFKGDKTRIEPTPDGDVYFLTHTERACLAIHRHIIEDAAFEDPYASGAIQGVGIRSRIYWTWYQMQESLAMLIEFLERVGLGITLYYYPAGDEAARASVEAVAKEQNQNSHILVPRTAGDPSLDAYGIERIEPNAGGVQVLQDVIVNLFAHRIKRYILGQTLTTESDGAGLGSSGISDLHKWGFFQIIKSDAIDLEETMTAEVVNRLVEFNPCLAAAYNSRFVIDTEAPDVQGQLDAFQKAFDMGMAIVEDDVRDLIGATRPTADTPVLSMKQMQAANAAMSGMGIGGNVGGNAIGAGGEPPVKINAGESGAEAGSGGGDVHDTLRAALKEHRAGEAANQEWYSDQYRASGEVHRYEANGSTWITIGAKAGADGKRHGGTPVLIRGGKIVSGPAALRGKSLKGITNKDESDSRLGSAIAEAGAKHRIKRSILKDAVDFVWEEKRNAVDARESVKKKLRESIGLNQADFNRIANKGGDWTQIPHFDEAAQEAAREYPELGIGDPDSKTADLSSRLWEIIAEGKIDAPARHSDEIIDEAVEMIRGARAYRPNGGDDLDNVPFSKVREYCEACEIIREAYAK